MHYEIQVPPGFANKDLSRFSSNVDGRTSTFRPCIASHHNIKRQIQCSESNKEAKKNVKGGEESSPAHAKARTFEAKQMPAQSVWCTTRANAESTC